MNIRYAVVQLLMHRYSDSPDMRIQQASVDMLADAFMAALEYLLARGAVPPPPPAGATRHVQLAPPAVERPVQPAVATGYADDIIQAVQRAFTRERFANPALVPGAELTAAQDAPRPRRLPESARQGFELGDMLLRLEPGEALAGRGGALPLYWHAVDAQRK